MHGTAVLARLEAPAKLMGGGTSRQHDPFRARGIIVI
jgi:hypothetical protein